MTRIFELIFILLFAAMPSLYAEQSVLVVQVKDINKRAIVRLQMRAEGSPPGAPTDDGGVARLRLDPKIKPGQWVTIQLFKPQKDLVFISPWDERVIVPPFDSATEVPVVLANRGDRALLENGTALTSMTASVLKKIQPQTKNEPATGEQRQADALAEVSRIYGLKPEDLDKAIRSWGEKTEDPYEKGLAELYAKHYPAATVQLQKSLAMREGELVKAQGKVADASFYLGKSLYEEGKYREASTAFQKSQKVRPDESVVLNNLGMSLAEAGDYVGAEPLLRCALTITERELGPDHESTATSLNNLALLLESKGDYAGAEPLYRRALAINEKALGPDHERTATSLNNLAELLRLRGDYAGAEPLDRRALAIREKALGPDHADTAGSLTSLANLLHDKGDYAGAEPLHRRALAITEKALGPNHPRTATSLANLAFLLKTKGDYAGAEPLYRRALAIREKALGPDHSDTAVSLNNLAELLQEKGDYAEAEPLYRRALAINEKALGPDHPSTAYSLNNLASFLYTREDYAGAEPLYRRALAIDEKALGPNHPTTRTIRANLDALLNKTAK